MMKLFVLLVLACSAMTLSALENTDFSHGLEKWVIAPKEAVEGSVEAGTLRLKVVGEHKFDGAASQRTTDYPRAEFLYASVEARSSKDGAGYLQVKTYRNGKELKRYSSENSRTKYSTLRCKVPTEGIDRIEVCLRVKLGEAWQGETTEFRNPAVFAQEPKEKKADAVALVPLYHSASFYCALPSAPPAGTVTEFRKAEGGEWRQTFPPEWDPKTLQLRGGIVNLEEDTLYEFRLAESGKEPVVRRFRTWSGKVPVAKTIRLDGSARITEKGTPEGYIRYTAEPGTVLTAEEGPVLEIRDAEYLIFEDLTIHGGQRNAIDVADSKHIRFLNCDISGWGRPGVPRFDKDGKPYLPGEERAVNYDAGIRIFDSVGVTVERCRFHDPRISANPWFYSHPSGPTAIYVGLLEQTVLRWNDFLGSNQHRWNDAVEGWGNFRPNGGFQRDADIYGNLFAFGNDDAIELDGRQMNIRFFDNRIEGFLCGISTVACIDGPSYCYGNLVDRLGDEMYAGSCAFKSGDGEGMLHAFHNTLVAPKGLVSVNERSPLRATSRNNVFLGVDAAIYERESRPGNSFDYDLAWLTRRSKTRVVSPETAFQAVNVGKNMLFAAPQFTASGSCDFSLKPGTPGSGDAVDIPNFSRGNDRGIHTDGANFPPRPGIGFSVNASRIDFAASTAPAQTLTVTPSADAEYRIVFNGVCDWISVEPAAGKLKAGTPLTLTVRLIPEKLKWTGLQVGGFLIRRPDGLSRPILVYADCDDREERLHPEILPATILKGDRNTPAAKGSFEFEIPEDGEYYAAIRLRENGNGLVRVNWQIDDRTFHSNTRTEHFFFYPATLRNSSSFLAQLERIPLKAGKHTLRWEADSPLFFDQAVITRNPPWRLFSRYLP